MQSTASMEMLSWGSNAAVDHSRWKDLYQIAFVAALLALTWFGIVALKFLKLMQMENQS